MEYPVNHLNVGWGRGHNRVICLFIQMVFLIMEYIVFCNKCNIGYTVQVVLIKNLFLLKSILIRIFFFGFGFLLKLKDHHRLHHNELWCHGILVH